MFLTQRGRWMGGERNSQPERLRDRPGTYIGGEVPGPYTHVGFSVPGPYTPDLSRLRCVQVPSVTPGTTGSGTSRSVAGWEAGWGAGWDGTLWSRRGSQVELC
eukprot:1437867-Rhodomonas_salina.1